MTESICIYIGPGTLRGLGADGEINMYMVPWDKSQRTTCNGESYYKLQRHEQANNHEFAGERFHQQSHV